MKRVIVRKENGRVMIQRNGQTKAVVDEILAVKSEVGLRVEQELLRQLDKWGAKHCRHVPLHQMLTITTEEYGETAMSINDRDYLGAMKECVETIACLVRLYQQLDDEHKRDNHVKEVEGE
jgi:hypothetical protein